MHKKPEKLIITYFFGFMFYFLYKLAFEKLVFV